MTGILARWAQPELKTSKLLVNTDHSNSNFPSHPSQELRALQYGSERAAEVGCSSQGIPFAKSRLRLWLQARTHTHTLLSTPQVAQHSQLARSSLPHCTRTCRNPLPLGSRCPSRRLKTNKQHCQPNDVGKSVSL